MKGTPYQEGALTVEDTMVVCRGKSAFGGRQVKYRIEQVRLSAAIFTDQNINPGRKFKVCFPIVLEIQQLKGIQSHEELPGKFGECSFGD
jgi:hypothetical protein